MTIELINLDLHHDHEYDVLIFAVGYEARARFFAENVHKTANIVLGYVFPTGHIFSYDANAAFLKEIGGHFLPEGRSIQDGLVQITGGASFVGSKICIDVSSLNRGAMAALLSELVDSDFFCGAEITVVYSIARFELPLYEEVDFLDFGPLDGFDGWTSNPERPSVLILGLGYETDHAVGALEFLDPSATFAFSPLGIDERFAEQVRKANESFLELVNPDRIIHYPVMSPYQTFWQMRSLILSLTNVARTILVPMGPKIFCRLCIICQGMVGDEVSVWRASGHSLDSARDAQAEGEVTGYLLRRNLGERNHPT